MRLLLRRFLTSVLGGAALLCLASSCEEMGLGNLAIKVGSNKVEIPAQGGEATIEAEIPLSWSITTDATWVKVTPDSGEAGNVTLRFSADANLGPDQRSCTAVLSADVEKKEIYVVQPAMESPTPGEETSFQTGISDWEEGGSSTEDNGIKYNLFNITTQEFLLMEETSPSAFSYTFDNFAEGIEFVISVDPGYTQYGPTSTEPKTLSGSVTTFIVRPNMGWFHFTGYEGKLTVSFFPDEGVVRCYKD